MNVLGFKTQFCCTVILQIRTATKRAAGSRTSMKDSAGRRLGPKKHEGEFTRPGEIIMRQRGTKFFPGEHVGIGKDHTIFALERGFVRYYLDPFHPRRKFIGVALDQQNQLPTPHFDPTPRRFGRILLDNNRARDKEEQSLTRKQFTLKDEYLKEQQRRESNRDRKKREFKEFLLKNTDIRTENWEYLLTYLIRLRSNLRNGFQAEDAQYYAKHYLQILLKNRANSELWQKDKLETELKCVLDISNKLDSLVSFDNKFTLIERMSPEQKKEAREQFIKDLKGRSTNMLDKKTVEELQNLFSKSSHFLSLSEELKLKKQYMQPVQTMLSKKVMKGKNKEARNDIKSYDYESGRIVTVVRGNNFPSKRV